MVTKGFSFQNGQILFFPQFAYLIGNLWSLATRYLFRVLHAIISIKQYHSAICQPVDNHG